MKTLKLSFLTLLIAAFCTLAFVACKKDMKDPLVTSDARGGGGTPAPTPAFILTLPTFGTACESTTEDQYCFDASILNNGGNPPGGNNVIDATILDASGNVVSGPQTVNSNTASFCFSGLVAGTYTVKVHYTHTPSEHSTPTQGTYSFILTVQSSSVCGTSSCTESGLSLTRSSTQVAVDENFNAVNVNLTYIVTNCGATDVTGLKLQGGLVNKGSLKGVPTSTGGATNLLYSLKTTGGNNVLTWTFDLAAAKTQQFNILYSVWGTACGGFLTGEWSLKLNGVAVGVAAEDAGTQTGYMSRLLWNCP